MVSKRVIPAVLIMGALAATPAWAQEHRRRGGGDQREQATQQAPRAQSRERAVPRDQAPRNVAPRQNQAPRYVAPRLDQAPRYVAPRLDQAPRYVAPRQDQAPRYVAPRQNQAPRYAAPPQVQRRYDAPRGYDRAVPRQYERRDYDDHRGGYPYYGSRSYGYGYGYGHAPRIIRPSIITVVPYRPYVYRPSWSIGVYYGYDGAYPYGYTPRGYYDPLPGHVYGGLRITGMPPDAQVFADGYFVGIVNDFDGVFQHLNLEAGPHHIEIQLAGGYEPVAFDVMVQPGQTITYRAAY